MCLRSSRVDRRGLKEENMAHFRAEPERIERIDPLRQEQNKLYKQQQAALQGSGTGGVYGDTADYYRDLLSGQGSEAFEALLMRQFREDIMPGIAEQFAGMGAGGLSSGGFAQESGRAGTDLSERIGIMRAEFRQRGAEGLTAMAGQGMQPRDEMLFRPREPSTAEKFATAAAGGAGQAAGYAASQYMTPGFIQK